MLLLSMRRHQDTTRRQAHLESRLNVQPLLRRRPLQHRGRRHKCRIEAVAWLGRRKCRSTAPPTVPHKRLLPESGAPPRGDVSGDVAAGGLGQENCAGPA